MISEYDFSTRARIKRFMRANKKNFIALGITCFILVLLLAIIIISAATDSDDYLTLENYTKITTDGTMSYEVVRKVLENHEGTPIGTGRGLYKWEDSSGERWIIIRTDEKGNVTYKEESGLE